MLPISLATSISLSIPRRMPTEGEHARRSTSRRQRKISITPGTMPLSPCLRSSSKRPTEATARKLEALYPDTRDLATWKPGESEQIAWESHQLAKSDVYRALGIPERGCSMHSCDTATNTPVTMSSSYMDREAQVAGRQLARHRLAALLNQIWPSTTAALPE
jgi:hypothetical protein